MAQNMSVSVTLRMQDQFTGPVRALLHQFQGLTRAAQDFNRAAGGAGSSSSGFGRIQQQVRGVANEVQRLAGQFSGLARSMVTPTGGGSFAQRQIADMRQLISLQQQAITNNARMVAGPAGSAVARGPNGPGSVWGRSGFSPNASFMDRAQFRAVNEAERAFAMGAIDLDLARTQLRMLSMPRRDPNDENNLLPGVIRPEIVTQIEAEAHGLTQQFRALNRAHILDTFRELVTNFQDAGTDAAAAFRLLPLMLHTQEWQILQGDTVPQAREGMLRLVRAMGLSSRLVDSGGNLQINQATGRPEAELFIENYLRARMMGGRDVSPDQVFQVMKYAKTSGHTMSPEAMLLAFIGMPDIRGSTFGHQLFMMQRQLTGRATQANQRALEAAGLGTITAREGSGPHSFQVVDPVLLQDNPFMWFHQHILEGYLRRQRGIDWTKAPSAEIAAALNPLFGNMSASNMAQTFAQQLPEWLTMARNAARANLSGEARRLLGSGSTWFQLQAARSRLQEVMASVAESFKVLLPILETINRQLGKVAAFMDPQVGNPFTGLGLLGSGAMAAFIMARRMIGGMREEPHRSHRACIRIEPSDVLRGRRDWGSVSNVLLGLGPFRFLSRSDPLSKRQDNGSD